MTEQSLRNQLVAIIRQSRQTEHDLETSLSKEARDVQGSLDGWSAKDVIVHIAATRGELSHNLVAGREGGEAIVYHDNFQEQNDRIFTRYQNASWQEVNTYADDTMGALVAEIECHTDDQLRQPQIYTWMREDGSILSETLGIITHAYEHVAEVYIQEGNGDTTLGLHETMLPIYQALNPTPRMLGTAKYNLACSYAQMGRGDLAMPLLPGAFELRPDLLEWAKEDSDLDSLRDRAEFQALYT